MEKRAPGRPGGRPLPAAAQVIYSQELLWIVKESTKQGPLDHDQCDVDASECLIHPLWPVLPVSGVTAKGHSVSVLKGC